LVRKLKNLRKDFKSSYDKAREAEDKIKAAAEKREKIKEGVKTTAKTTAKAAGATGAAGATYIVGEGMSPSQTGPVSEAIRKCKEKVAIENQMKEKVAIEKKRKRNQ
jgi:imidazolonepropionase-like amidohydrolase